MIVIEVTELVKYTRIDYPNGYCVEVRYNNRCCDSVNCPTNTNPKVFFSEGTRVIGKYCHGFTEAAHSFEVNVRNRSGKTCLMTGEVVKEKTYLNNPISTYNFISVNSLSEIMYLVSRLKKDYDE